MFCFSGRGGRDTSLSCSAAVDWPDTGDMPDRPLPPQTRFGSPLLPLERSASVLRARATAGGLQLAPVHSADLAGAVVAADAWVYVTGVELGDSRTAGPSALVSLAAILSRSAGRAGVPATAVHDEREFLADLLPAPEQVHLWLATAENHAAMARLLAGDDAIAALRAAAYDLATAGYDSPLAAYGALLAVCADFEEIGQD